MTAKQSNRLKSAQMVVDITNSSVHALQENLLQNEERAVYLTRPPSQTGVEQKRYH